MNTLVRPSATLLRRFARAQACSASSLVIAEHNGATLTPGTLSTIKAAGQIGGDVTVLVVGGANVGAVASKAASVAGVSKVLSLENASLGHSVAENYTKAIAPLAKNYTHVLTPSSNTGKNFLPRLAAVLDSQPLTDISAVIDAETFKRPTYAGNAVATVKMSDAIKFLLVRTTAFDKAAETGGSATVEAVAAADADAKLATFVSENAVKSARPDLTTAKVVVSGGRGMKNGENFAMLETLADKLGGAVGASRAAVDAGFVPNDLQIGQTGKVVAPDLYIAVGISGAIQHLSGMKDSKTIVAINKDKEAPIFQVADYGLVEDLFKAVPELNSKI